MDLHLVGGFLGSGKTTGIIAACRNLVEQGKTVGVVTNDQGKYLVDTAFFQAANLPTVEVTGGCFCCRYEDLEEVLSKLDASASPDIIFAESVGSCADLVATVVRPLIASEAVQTVMQSFTVFADIRLLDRRVREEPMPFADALVYLFDQQIAEAGWLVINKADLVTRHRARLILESVRERYPDKQILLQDSRERAGARGWLKGITSGPKQIGTVTADLDYPAYGAAEAELAWLNQRVTIRSDTKPISRLVEEWIARILAGLNGARATIGHLKFCLTTSDETVKVSLTTIVDPAWRHALNALRGTEVDILVNARVVLDASELQRIISDATDTIPGAASSDESPDAFHPAFPTPTHRILSP